jgi:hypothetical protein
LLPALLDDVCHIFVEPGRNGRAFAVCDTDLDIVVAHAIVDGPALSRKGRVGRYRIGDGAGWDRIQEWGAI